MAKDIAQWLDSLGLGQYAQAFADNGIDIEALPHLRDEDFERLGVLLGHMRRLQAAIETLSADEPLIQPVPVPSREPRTPTCRGRAPPDHSDVRRSCGLHGAVQASRPRGFAGSHPQ